MKRINYVLILLSVTTLLFTSCNTSRYAIMSVAQLDRITPTPVKITTDTTHYTYIKPSPTPPKLIDPKDNFEQSYQELKAMLQGTKIVDFERAVYLSENPYHNNKYTYEQFQKMFKIPLSCIQKLIKANDKSDTMNFDVKVGANGKFKMADMRFLPKEKKELYRKALSNWAIFTYITDTTRMYPFYQEPMIYIANDPFGKNDWNNTQVIHLLNSRQNSGNCYSLTAFFKILSNRLNTGTRLCTAPQHVYIQHRDTKGDYYNIELATAGFPRDGTLQTLTYTTDEALKNGIALRDYTERQSIGLCMINLAKSYEHYYETQTDTFLLQCAETVLQYDSLNLSALLLKQQVLDERVNQYAKQKSISNIALLKQDKTIQTTINDLEKHNALLYSLGYRQMPLDMQQIILSGNYPKEFKDQNPSPYSDPRISKDEKLGKYQALYGGLFKEVFEEQPTEQYRHFVFDTKTKQLKSINLNVLENELIDPVAFAYDFGARFYDARLGRFTSVDPLTKKYPEQSPYMAFGNNPILNIDIAGEFKFSANTLALMKSEYPTAYKYLYENVKLNAPGNVTELTKSAKIVNTIIANTPHANLDKAGKVPDVLYYQDEKFNLTKEKIVDAFKNGNGQEIIITDAPGGYANASGYNTGLDDGTDYKTQIQLNTKLFQNIENAKTDAEKVEALTTLSSILIQEYMEDFGDDAYRYDIITEFDKKLYQQVVVSYKEFGNKMAGSQIYGVGEYPDLGNYPRGAKGAVEFNTNGNNNDCDDSVIPILPK